MKNDTAKDLIHQLKNPFVREGLTVHRAIGRAVRDYNGHEEIEIKQFLFGELAKAARMFKTGKGMDSEEILDCIDLILETYRDLSPQDFVVFCKSIVVGKIHIGLTKRVYEKTYGAVDIPLVMRWMETYYEAKLDAREDQDARQKHEDWSFQPWPLEVVQSAYKTLEKEKVLPEPIESVPSHYNQYMAILPGLHDMSQNECRDLLDETKTRGNFPLAGLIEKFIEEKFAK